MARKKRLFKTEKKNNFYSLKEILKYDAVYNVIIGQRSNGKTFSVLTYMLREYLLHGKRSIMIRRKKSEINAYKLQEIFTSIIEANDDIKQALGDTTYNRVYYFRRHFYLAYEDEMGNIKKEKNPFLRVVAIEEGYDNKGARSFVCSIVMFDEFLTNEFYLPDEFVKFMNILSTFCDRYEPKPKIFLLGNTVNKYCPYFLEMGLKNVRIQKQGTIDYYLCENGKTSVALEYCDKIENDDLDKMNELLFGFNNQKMGMITNGVWEIGRIYPRIPDFYEKDVKGRFFIEFDSQRLMCSVVKSKDNDYFLAVQKKTTEIKNPDKDLVFRGEDSIKKNIRKNLLRCSDLGRFYAIIKTLITTEKVVFQDNDTGETFDNYLKWCKIN